MIWIHKYNKYSSSLAKPSDIIKINYKYLIDDLKCKEKIYV